MNFKAIVQVTSAIAILGATSVARAQEDWAGFYAGLGIVAPVDSNMVYRGVRFPLESATPVTAEGFAGFNHVINHLLIGGEVVFVGANYVLGGDPDYHFAGVGDARARLGFAGDGWMVYFFGGLSAGIFDNGGDPINMFGTNFGAGVSAMVSDNLFVGVEVAQRNLSGEFDGGGKGKSYTLESTSRVISARAGMLF